MFKIYFVTDNFRDLIKAFDTEISAVNYAVDHLGALFLEEDAAHPGCYDGIDHRCRMICIEKNKG